MTRRQTISRPGLALLALGLLATGCASTATVVPGRTLALFEVQYPEGRISGTPLETGDAPATVRMARALVREFGREGFYQLVDVRNLGVHASDLGKDAAKSASLRQAAPADAYLGVKLLGCTARANSATESRGTGSSATSVTVYWYGGECAAELTAYDAEGKTIAILQKTGRWDSPRQDRPDGSSMQSQALTNAVDDAARRLASEIRPAAAEKK